MLKCVQSYTLAFTGDSQFVQGGVKDSLHDFVSTEWATPAIDESQFMATHGHFVDVNSGA
jgi:hypothetical protein